MESMLESSTMSKSETVRMGETDCVNCARLTLSRRRVLGIVPAVLCQACCGCERKALT